MERRKLPKFGCKRFALDAITTLWAPICALSLALSSKHTAGYNTSIGLEELWLLFASFFVYNIHTKYSELRTVAKSSGLIAALLTIALPPISSQIALFAGLLWLGYYYSLRSLAILKPILIGLVWVLTTHAIPIHDWRWNEIAFFRFGLVFVLSLAYDLVDQQRDLTQNTQTLVLLLGFKTSMLLSTLILGFLSCLSWSVISIRLPILVSSGCSIGILVLLAWKNAPISPDNPLWKILIDSVLLFYSISSFFPTS